MKRLKIREGFPDIFDLLEENKILKPTPEKRESAKHPSSEENKTKERRDIAPKEEQASGHAFAPGLDQCM